MAGSVGLAALASRDNVQRRMPVRPTTPPRFFKSASAVASEVRLTEPEFALNRLFEEACYPRTIHRLVSALNSESLR